MRLPVVEREEVGTTAFVACWQQLRLGGELLIN